MSNNYFSEGHDFIDEQNFEDNGQITAIQLRAGSENIFAIRARLITLPYIKVRQIQNDFFKPTFLPKNERTNLFLLLVDLILLVFGRW